MTVEEMSAGSVSTEEEVLKERQGAMSVVWARFGFSKHNTEQN